MKTINLMKTLVISVVLGIGLGSSALAGGRMGHHGMVVFGSGAESGEYFIEHIPMLSPPHDLQIIAQVRLSLADGTPLTADLSQTGFTLRPLAHFSLDDFSHGKLQAFPGAIHRGSFEQSGPEVPGLEKVQVTVIALPLVRPLPAASAEKVFRVSSAGKTYETNLITPAASFQRIRNVTDDRLLWCVDGPDFFEPCAAN